MTAELQAAKTDPKPSPLETKLCLRLSLSSGQFSIPLYRVHHLAGFATLTGEPDDYFRGWLSFRGEPVPVFDLNRVMCDQATPEHFSSRIILLNAGSGSPTSRVGLLATGITDTVSSDPASAIEALDLESFLPMLYTLIPPLPSPLS